MKKTCKHEWRHSFNSYYDKVLGKVTYICTKCSTFKDEIINAEVIPEPVGLK